MSNASDDTTNRAGRAHTAPSFSLGVQYAVSSPAMPRWRIRRWVQRALEHIIADGKIGNSKHICLTLRIVDANEARMLNAAWRQRDYPTNVLSFEYGQDPQGNISGDIVLCYPVLHQEAVEQGKPLLHHAAHLVIHGVLHALGYDHILDDEALHMESLETAILAGMGIPDPYHPGTGPEPG